MKTGVLDWEVRSVMMAGESVSGDRLVVKTLDDGLLVAVIDGIGHGQAAANSADLAAITVEDNADQELVAMLRLCHNSLATERGAVISLVKLGHNNTLTWLGIGNVQVELLRSHNVGTIRRVERPVLKSGMLGSGQLPAMQAVSISVNNNDLLLIATDGIEPGFVDSIDINAASEAIADQIMNNYNKHTDDALVFVGRYVS